MSSYPFVSSCFSSGNVLFPQRVWVACRCFLRTLLRLFIYLLHHLQSGNTHLQLLLLLTKVFTQMVRKHWHQVMTERGKKPQSQCKVKCLILTPLFTVGEGQRLQSRGMKVENEPKINPVVLGKHSTSKKCAPILRCKWKWVSVEIYQSALAGAQVHSYLCIKSILTVGCVPPTVP